MKRLKGVPILGEKLKKFREDDLGLTQEELGDVIDMSKNNISAKESPGVTGLSRKWFKRLAIHAFKGVSESESLKRLRLRIGASDAEVAAAGFSVAQPPRRAGAMRKMIERFEEIARIENRPVEDVAGDALRLYSKQPAAKSVTPTAARQPVQQKKKR